ncbi:MAG: hypothetical protein Q8N99_08505 [Nanoarchaeota archaeon]|nr:hypothetical protein [Nanoarchaeota archaeon]
MVNEEILTALKNSLDHGDSLHTAVIILKNTGYNPKEVDEASKFVGQGVIVNLQAKPEEHLTLPSQKNVLGKEIKKPPITAASQPIQQQNLQKSVISQDVNAIKKNISTGAVITQNRPIQQVQPLQSVQAQNNSRQLPAQTQQRIQRPSYKKEIALLVILLVLVGLLISTFIFKDPILKFLSNALGIK